MNSMDRYGMNINRLLINNRKLEIFAFFPFEKEISKFPNRNEGKWTPKLPQSSPFREILGWSPKGEFKGSPKSIK